MCRSGRRLISQLQLSAEIPNHPHHAHLGSIGADESAERPDLMGAIPPAPAGDEQPVTPPLTAKKAEPVGPADERATKAGSRRRGPSEHPRWKIAREWMLAIAAVVVAGAVFLPKEKDKSHGPISIVEAPAEDNEADDGAGPAPTSEGQPFRANGPQAPTPLPSTAPRRNGNPVPGQDASVVISEGVVPASPSPPEPESSSSAWDTVTVALPSDGEFVSALVNGDSLSTIELNGQSLKLFIRAPNYPYAITIRYEDPAGDERSCQTRTVNGKRQLALSMPCRRLQ
jgi:hypothetical protein